MHDSLLNLPDSFAAPPTSDGGNDTLFDSLLWQESRGKQLRDDGTPVTSPKGAIGIAQVMPGTAREAAQLAGLEYDDFRYRTDAEYNKSLGRAYFNKQLKDFGDESMALAAYNAGPGAMRRARAAAEKAGTPDQWLQFLPAETQAYVPSILARVGRTPGSSTAPRSAQSPATQPGNSEASPFYTPVRGMYASLITPPLPERSLLGAANDTVIEAANAAAGGLKAGVDFVGVASGMYAPDNALSEALDRFIKSGEASQSDAVKAEKQRLATEMDDAEGAGDEIVAFLSYAARNPVLAAAQAAGSFAVPGAAVKGAKFLGKLAGASGAGATTAGMLGGSAAGAALGGGDAAGTAFDLVMATPDEVVMQSPDAKELLAGKMTPAEVKRELATRAARAASVKPAAVGAVTGGIGAERLLAGAARGATRGGQALRTGLIEGGSESFEEGLTQYEGQAAAARYNPEIDPMKGVAGAATAGAVMGGAAGAGIGAIVGPTARPQVAPGLERVADAAANGGTLSRAAMAGNTPEAVAARQAEAAAQGQATAAPDGAARLAELEAIARGTPEAKGADGQTIPGTPGRFFTPEEKAEYDNLVGLRDATEKVAGSAEPEADQIGARVSEIEGQIRADGMMATLRAEGADVKSLVKDLAIAKSPSTPAAQREQALARVEYTLGWSGVAQPVNQPAARPTPADPIDAALANPQVSDADRQSLMIARSAMNNDRLPAATRENARREALEIAGRYAAPSTPTATTQQAASPAVVGDIAPAPGTPEAALREAERLEEGAYQFRAEGYDAEAQQLRDQADSMREEAATRRAAAEEEARVEDVSTPAVRTTPPGAGSAVSRRRRATLDQLVADGLDRVERRDDGFYLVNSNGKRQFKLEGPGDAQMARAAIATHIQRGAEQANTNPTDGQKEAGNYKLGEVKFDGLTLAIENPQGSTRSGVDPSGERWTTTMPANYGYVRGSAQAADGDKVDIYLPNNARAGSPAWIIDQYNDDGSFDETKTVLGVATEAEALRIYDAGFSDGSGPSRRRGITQMPMEQFKEWVMSPAAKKPAAQPAPTAPAEDAAAQAPADQTPADPAAAPLTLTVNVDGQPVVLDLVPAEALGSRQKAVGKRFTISRGQAALLRAIAGAFGKRIVFFSTSENIGDGFVRPGDSSTIFLNQVSGISPMAVFGHELMHLLEMDNPKAHAAIRDAIEARLKKGARERMARYYAEGEILNEITSDVSGDIMSDPKFWREVFGKVQDDGAVAALIARVRQLVTNLISSLKQSGFGSEKLVNDLGSIRDALRDAMADYARARGENLSKVQARVMRADRDIRRADAKRSVLREARVRDRNGEDFEIRVTRQMLGALQNTPAILVEARTLDGNRRGFIDFSMVDGDVVQSENTMVAPQYRGRGLASLMYEAAADANFKIAPGRRQTEAGAGMVRSLQARGLIGAGDITRSVTRRQALETNVRVEMPDSQIFLRAVENTPRTLVDEDGLHMRLVRWQKPSQEGERSVRTGVFYLPEGSRNTRYYRTSEKLGDDSSYGGSQQQAGSTLIRRPLFVRGATGGKAPEAAYEQLNGKGSMARLESAVMSVITDRSVLGGQFVERVANFLRDHEADPQLASEIVRNSRRGNQLRYALQENVIAHAARKAGYDAIVGYSSGKAGPFISEVFDVREQTYPSDVLTSEVHESFLEPIDQAVTRSVDRGIHYSKQPRERLDGRFYGTGMKGGEARRLSRATDPRIKERVYAYLDGRPPEDGVGGYAHEVELSNLYDAGRDPLGLWRTADLNDAESAVLDNGFDGYKVNGVAVVMGPASHDIAARPLNGSAADRVARKSLMSREINEIDVDAIPGARMRAGILHVPATSLVHANAELERIGSPVRFSRERLDTPADEYREVEKRLRGTKGWMKAPNGQPTRLNERQWVHVRTPSFKAWFGDWEHFAGVPGGVWSDDSKSVSKAVDANGEPLVVYHGSSKAGFSEFQQAGGRGRGDMGIFTTSSLYMAETYARVGRPRSVEEGDLDQSGDGESSDVDQFGGVYALFINARNPHEDNFEGAYWTGDRDEQYQVIDEDGESVYSPEGYAHLTKQEAEELAGQEPGRVVKPSDPLGYNTDSVAREARSFGNDSAIIRAVVDDGGGPGRYYGDPSDIFVAFDPNQVKSADFNDGSYSIHQNDIRRSVDREAPDTPAFRKWFGKSKVVDADGKPLVVYHGSTVSPTVFRPSATGTFGPGIYFAKSGASAQEYGDRITEAYVSLQNPWIVDADIESPVAYAEDHDNPGIEAVLALPNGRRILDEAKREESEHFGQSLQDELLRLGHDGVVATYPDGSMEVVAFRSSQVKSATGNSGAFDPADVDITRSVDRSSRDVIRKPADFKKAYGLNPKSNGVRQIGEALNRRTVEEFGQIADTDTSSEARDVLAAAMADEVEHQIGKIRSSGVGWYSKDYPKALRTLGNVYPELKRSPGARGLFTALLAVTSNGEKVQRNIAMARQLYEAHREGRSLLDNLPGTMRADALRGNVKVIADLLEQYGGPNGMARALLEEMRVGDINAQLRKEGKKPSSDYPASMTMPRAALYFGPKLGAFYANLMGTHGYLTMDLWWSRTFNRMRGTLIPQPTEGAMEYMRGAMGRDDATIEDMVEFAEPYRQAYARRGYKNGSELEKRANTFMKSAALELNEAPMRASDREFMFETAVRAQENLRQRGVDMTIADIQAALWYYEKRLYGALGSRVLEDIGYSEALKNAAQSNRPGGPASRSGGEPDAGAASEDVSAQQGAAGAAQETGGGRSVRRSATRDGRGQSRSAEEALPGAPRVAGATGPDPRLVAVAEAYAQKIGIPLRRQAEYVQVDPQRAARIADAYAAMPHEPDSPRVKAAYEELIRQTLAQYDALVDAGYEFYFADQENDPYGGNPWNAMRDLRANRRMAVFPTAEGFGTNATFDPAENPLLADTGLTWPLGSLNGERHRVLANDLFRAVHDAFGHGLEGAGFRAQGEENAWQAHVRLFHGDAVGAITTETRGQNSWLNYNPVSGERNRTAKVEDTVFADQKTGLMPEWTWIEGRVADMPGDAPLARSEPPEQINERIDALEDLIACLKK